ncbi:hypothetical protein CIHG_01099 [Coccidioides immitis H538.4]|uniref:Uncharacterized protein n=1 Tax=Coccidioides immitis H538.4 TaxID=396776 RepID=A0A0J8REH1_COCIT|nr:hypothetical protein CIHG_01099 [Coccidioides immitis H538.4]
MLSVAANASSRHKESRMEPANASIAGRSFEVKRSVAAGDDCRLGLPALVIHRERSPSDVLRSSPRRGNSASGVRSPEEGYYDCEALGTKQSTPIIGKRIH